jgi:hypothetical protein
VACVHQISYMDFWRGPQTIQAGSLPQQETGGLVQIR